MTSPYYNTNVQRILKFDDLTDEEVREITKYPFTKKRFDCNSLDEWLEGQDGYKDGGGNGIFDRFACCDYFFIHDNSPVAMIF